MDKVAAGQRALDWRAVINSPLDFKAVASSVSRLKPVALGGYKNQKELLTALRASSAIPLLCGGPVEIEGELFFDASLFESIPFKTAIEDGCSHVLALLTRPRGSLRENTFFLHRRLVGAYLARLNPGLRRPFLERPLKYAQEIEELERTSTRPGRPPHVLAVQLDRGSETISQMEKRRTRLLAGAARGRRAVFKTMVDACPQLVRAAGGPRIRVRG